MSRTNSISAIAPLVVLIVESVLALPDRHNYHQPQIDSNSFHATQPEKWDAYRRSRLFPGQLQATKGNREDSGFLQILLKQSPTCATMRGGSDNEHTSHRGSGEQSAQTAVDQFEKLLCTSRSEIINAFRSLDADNSGVITRTELGPALEVLGIIATPGEVDFIFDTLDENNDETINLEVLSPFGKQLAARSASVCLDHGPLI